MVTYSIWDDLQDIDDIRLNALMLVYCYDPCDGNRSTVCVNHRVLGNRMSSIIDGETFVDMLKVSKRRRFNLRELTSAFNEHIPRNGVHVIDQLMNDVTSIAGDLPFVVRLSSCLV